MSSKRLFLFLILSVILLSPSIADACTMCQGASGYSKATVNAYRGITLLLAFLPILGGGGLFYWIYKRYKKLEE